MMQSIEAIGVNDAYVNTLEYMRHVAVPDDSRNGKVWRMPGPWMTSYSDPYRRVLFSPMRDANPFFHLMEAIWMLAGRNDVGFVAKFNKRMLTFSDDGATLSGAYGYRWTKHFAVNQLDWIANTLAGDKTNRRCVLQMWDPVTDIGRVLADGKDVPCNTNVYFLCRGGALDMTVCCRSNDLFWGCYGANMVHFSFLHEWMAEAVGVPVGRYHHLSNDLHVYEEHFPRERWQQYAQDADITGLYRRGSLPHYNILQGQPAHEWRAEAVTWCRGEPARSAFFIDVAEPAYAAWMAHKAKNHKAALNYAETIAAWDWRAACTAWLQRHSESVAYAAQPAVGGGLGAAQAS